MRTVLLVEPSEPLRELTLRHLGTALPRLELIGVSDLDGGRSCLQSTRCDVLVVAWELAEGTAIELLAEAAALEHRPAVVVTTLGGAAPTEMERHMPATWLLKPYCLDDLTECVAAALRPSVSRPR